eukprot:1157065-Pelagomonas_calceolata.AAC.1
MLVFLNTPIAAAKAMGPLIRRFIGLGLNRVWLNSGDVAYRQEVPLVPPLACQLVLLPSKPCLFYPAIHVLCRPAIHVLGEASITVPKTHNRCSAGAFCAGTLVQDE